VNALFTEIGVHRIMAQQVRTAPEVATSAPVTLGDPGPLGLSAFALTTLVLSVMNANIISAANTGFIIALAVFYGGIAQMIAGVWEMRNNNTFGATAFVSFGAFWLSFAAIFIPGFGVNLTKLPGAAAAVGFYLMGWAIFTGFMAIAATRLNGALLGVFVLLFLTFACLCLGWFFGTPTATNTDFWIHLGGWLGIGTAILAWYTAFAGILRSTKGPIQLPVFPTR
jgi:succinate-acetate transporter protein